MKKRILISAISFLLIGSLVWAASSVNINVNAVVPNSSPDINVAILKFTDGNPDNNPWTNSTEVASMDFGTLKHTLADGSEAGLWFSDAGFCVVIYTQPYGKPYDVGSTCAGLTSGANSLPAGSFGLTPAYSPNDEWSPGYPQGPMPSGASLGTAGPAVDTNKLIYSSESGTGTARIIQTYYSLPPYKTGGTEPFPGFTPIPLSQATGTYTGTVTITITPR